MKGAYYSSRARAGKMRLRPNPITGHHCLIARDDCTHIDLFAMWRAERPSIIILLVEWRHGGRGEPFRHEFYKIKYDPDAPMEWFKPINRLIAAEYDDLDTVRFNTTHTATHMYEWFAAYHLRFICPWLYSQRRLAVLSGRAVNTSVLCHYFHVYDLPPFPSNFVNRYTTHGKGNRAPSKWRAKDPNTVRRPRGRPRKDELA